MRRLSFAFGLLLMACVPFAAEARGDLNLTVTNASTTSALDVTVAGCACRTPLHLGIVPKGLQVTQPIPIGAGRMLTITARLPETVVVDQQTLTVSDEPADQLTVDVHKAKPLDANSADDLAHLLAQMGPYSGFHPLSLESAVPNFMGALLLHDASDPDAAPVVTIAPAAAGTQVRTDDMTFGPVNARARGTFTRTLPASIEPSIPLLAALGVPISDDGPSTLDTQIARAGAMTAKAGKLKTLGQALGGLAAADKTTLCESATSLKDPKLLYITTLYGVAGASFVERPSQKVVADAELTDDAVVVEDAAYIFDSARATTTAVHSAVISFTGNEIPLSVLCDPDTVVKRRVLVPKMAIYNLHPMTYIANYHPTVYDRIASTAMQAVVVPRRIVEAMAKPLQNPFVAPVTQPLAPPAMPDSTADPQPVATTAP